MEEYITYDLLDFERILWCAKREKKSKSTFPIVLTFLSESVLIAAIVIPIVWFISIGVTVRLWPIVPALIIIAGLFIYPRYSYIDKCSDLFYYLTNERIIILRRTHNKRIIRAQHIMDIETIKVRIKAKDKMSIFFESEDNVDIYEVKNNSEQTKRQIDVRVPMAFLSVQISEELLSILGSYNHIKFEAN